MPTPSQPVRLGPFRLLDLLGSGGAGQVWRARVDGQPLDLAVKLLRGRWDPEALDRFLAEARAAAGLDHPNLAQVLDFGVLEQDDDQVPYLAMDLASGGTLRDASLDWPRLADAVARVMDGLAHAHARGVIHLDVKAENVLLGLPRDGRAGWRVVDFGIAFATERELVDQPVCGTPTNMAPEQWRAAWRDFGPWTDVYGLACTVWDLVCGRPVHDGDVMDQARRHLQGELPPLRPTLPVPPGLGAWLARALQRAPRLRFQHMAEAADAWAALRDGDAAAPIQWAPSRPSALPSATFSFEELPLPEAPAPEPTAVPAVTRPMPARREEAARASVPMSMGGLGIGALTSRVPPTIGRAREQDALWDALRGVARDGEPARICLSGPSGCGKTRLADGLAELARVGAYAQVLRVEHDAVPGPRGGLAAALRAWMRVEGATSVELRARARVFLDEVGGDDPEDRERLVALLAGGPADTAALARVLTLAARRGPLVLVLDDAQWGPESLAVADVLRHVPVLVLATWEGEPSLPEAWRVLPLAPLETAEIRNLLDGLLPLTGPATARLTEGADGNPQEAVQRLLRHVQRGEIVPDGDRYALRPTAEPAPDDLDGLWASRLAEVVGPWSPAWADAIEVAAALGVGVEDDEWAAAVGARPEPALLAALLEARLAVRAPRASSWRFAHPRLRAVIERRAREAGRWREAHRRCAEALRALGRDAGRLGAHLLDAGDAEAAVPHLLGSAEAAMSGGRLHESARALARLDEAFAALGTPRTHPDRIAAAVYASRVERHRLGPAAVLSAARQTLEDARANGDPTLIAMACRAYAVPLREARRRDEARALVAEVLDHYGDGIAPRERAPLYATLGVCLAELGYGGDQSVVADAIRALHHARALGGLSLAQVGDCILYEARLATEPDAREAGLREALAAYRAAGTMVGCGLVHHELGGTAVRRDDPRAALAEYRESLRCFDQAGSQGAYTARLDVGAMLVTLGELDAARPILLVALDHGRRSGRRPLVALTLASLARIAVAEGRWDELAGLLDELESLGPTAPASELLGYLRDAAERARDAGRPEAERLATLPERLAIA